MRTTVFYVGGPNHDQEREEDVAGYSIRVTGPVAVSPLNRIPGERDPIHRYREGTYRLSPVAGIDDPEGCEPRAFVAIWIGWRR